MKKQEVTLNAELEGKGKIIQKLKQKLEERDDTICFYSDVYEAMEKKTSGLKQKLEDVTQ